MAKFVSKNETSGTTAEIMKDGGPSDTREIYIKVSAPQSGMGSDIVIWHAMTKDEAIDLMAWLSEVTR